MTLISKKARNRPLYIAFAIIAVFVIYFAIAIAPYSQEGLPQLITNFSSISFSPADLIWAEYTPKTILICLVIYFFAGLMLLSMKRRTHRSGVENGSADYADIRAMRKEFNSKSPERIVYTKNFALSVAEEDVYEHNRNYNTIIIGGPGSRKTTGFVYPNLLEASANYIVLDPKGEVCKKTAKYMQKQGYTVKVLNLKNPKRSWRYNPFAYIREDSAEDDIQKIVTAIYKATTAPNSQTLDPFWDEAGKMYLSALMYLLYYFGSPEEKNFPYLMNLIRAGRIENSEDDTIKSPLDLLFESIAEYSPDHICVRYYQDATSGAGKTMQSVQITLLARLQKFEISSVADMMSDDELELEKMATEKMVLYCVIPDNDTSYNFIIAILYIQLFQVLYDIADNEYDSGRLPRFIHFIMEEFFNVHVPDDFVNILGTCRSRNIGCSIILQTLAQLKEKYKEGWENIIGQCDEFLYLGSNGQSNNKYISEELGKETIDTTNYGRRYGMHGDSSTNYQFTGRELLTSDEIRQLDYETALLFIKGSPPLADKKINVFKYKKAKGTAIRGNKSMKYDIPLRADRLKTNSLEVSKEDTPQKDIFTATAVGSAKAQTTLEININGTESNIWIADIAELVDEYTFDFDEFEEYLNNF